MKNILKLSMLVVALAMPAFAANPVQTAAQVREVVNPKVEAELLSLIIKEARAGKSAQTVVTERLMQAGLSSEAAAQVWSGNTLVVGGLSLIEGLAKTQVTAGKLNADELAVFLKSEDFKSKASPIQVVRTMLDGKTNITKATFTAALTKAEETLASAQAAPKAPEKTDEELVMLASTIEFPRASTVPNTLVISPAQEALAKDESEVEDLRASWESNFKVGEDKIQEYRDANAGMDVTAHDHLRNIGIVANAVQAQGCPLNARDFGTLSAQCQASVSGMLNWILDPEIQGPASKERAEVAALAVSGWNHTDPAAVKKGWSLIMADGVRTKGARHKLPRNVPAANCARGDAYALAN